MPDTEATRTPGAYELHSGLSAIRGVYMGREDYPHAITIGHKLVALVHRLGEGPPTPDDETAANAAFVVRACNAHDALVTAALAAVERCVACAHERQWHGERACAMCGERDVLDACLTFRADEGLRAALALAEEADHVTAD